MGSKTQDMVLYLGSTIYPIKLFDPYKSLKDNMCGSYGWKLGVKSRSHAESPGPQ